MSDIDAQQAEVQRLHEQVRGLEAECRAAAEDQNSLRAENRQLREIVRIVASCPHGPDDYVILSISREMSNKARALLSDGQH